MYAMADNAVAVCLGSEKGACFWTGSMKRVAGETYTLRKTQSRKLILNQ